MKRTLSMLLVLAMLLSCLPMGALATEVETGPAETVAEATVEETEPAAETAEVMETIAEVVEIEEPVALAMEPRSTGDSGEAGEGVTWTLDNEGTLTISGEGEMTGRPWMTDYKTVIKKVIIEEGVTSIASEAFYGCSSLTEITVPKSVKKIGYSALRNCGIKEFTFHATLESVSDYAFWGSHLENLYVEDLSHFISFNHYYTELSYANLYVNGELVTDLIIPEGTEKITAYTFDCVSSLESVTIPGSVQSIGTYAFRGCENLKKVTIEEGTQSIGTYAFYGCENLAEVNLPSTLNAIQSYSFGGKNSLTELKIPVGVQVINSNAFYNSSYPYTTSLSELRFLGDAPLIASDGFTGITATARYSSTNESWTADKLQNYGGTITWVADDNISDTGGSADVYIIAEGYCGSNVYFVIYSNGEMTIKTATTYALRSAAANDMDDYASPEDAPWYPYRDQIKSITVEEGVNSVGENAFVGCENLTEVTIQDGVAEVGANAFAECTSLTEVTIEEGVSEIGDSAFAGCENLSEVTFHGNAPEFGENVFADVEVTVNYPANDESWSQEVVENLGESVVANPDVNLHSHNYAAEVTAPTCTENGYTTYTCECGDSYTADEVAATGHSYDSKVTEPTCTEQGYTTYTCGCGDSYVGGLLTVWKFLPSLAGLRITAAARVTSTAKTVIMCGSKPAR